MKLLKLVIKNFKCIKDLTVEAGGRNVNIYGDNATGKTTIDDAYNWILNGKDSLNRSAFGIKPIDPETQQPIQGVETEVEGVFNHNGRTFSLKKRYYEKWVKERGSAERTFSGNTTDYFVDEVPVKETEYKKAIADIADEKAFKLLSNPLMFNEQLHWTERRKMIIQVCGDVSVDEVIESNSKLSGLKAILGIHDVDKKKAIIAARKSEINKELEKIPARITEVKNLMPDIAGIVVSTAKAEIETLQKQQNELRAEQVRIESGGEIAEKKKRLAEITGELQSLKNAHEQNKADSIRELREQENNVAAEHRNLQNTYLTKQGESEALGREIETLENEINELLDKLDAVEGEQFTYPEFTCSQETVCPACGQPIPQDQLDSVCDAAKQAHETASEKALEAFNLDKSTRLDRILVTGKDKRRLQNEKKAKKAAIDAELSDLKTKGIQAKAKLEGIQKQIADAQTGFTDVTETPAYKLKSAELAQVNKAITDLQNGNSDRIYEIVSAISETNVKISGLNGKINLVDQAERSKARIDELKAEEKRLAKEYEQIEGELFTVEEFIRTKVRMLDEKINSRFKFVRFKLFNQQINGALDECCEALINTNGCWTPYSDANAAGRINGGIDIINTLSEFYKFETPIFVDNSESVVQLAETKAQLFRLVVSERDKALRIEVEAA